MAQITRELALKICHKLRAVNDTPKGAAHDRYGIYHGDMLVGSIGIRRSPRKDQGHDHVPKDLNVSPRFARELAICTKSRDDYLRQIGVLAEPEPQNEPSAPEPERHAEGIDRPQQPERRAEGIDRPQQRQ